MGASKRLAEQIIQAFSEETVNSNNTRIKYSIVRFGNVLGSSGSVVPLFKKQIKEGGPITLTHPEITRYFMTITEAAQLVIQSSSLSTGGDLFLLDMGKPVRIINLAKDMIRLSGLTLKDDNNKDGDIEIVISGLRPGEKVYEELLIDGKSTPTKHPLIFRAKENYMSPSSLWPQLTRLRTAISSQNNIESIRLLNEMVPEWTPYVE